MPAFEVDTPRPSLQPTQATRILNPESFTTPPSPPAPLLQAGAERLVHGLGPLYRVHADSSFDAFARDALGSVLAEVSATGTVTNPFDYTAYGALRASLAGPPLLGFAGELQDPSGLIYLRARWYDADLARFISVDPLFARPAEPASLNGYTYADGRPLNLIDPLGTTPLMFTLSAGPEAACGPTSGECTYRVGNVTVVNNAGGVRGFLVRTLAFGQENTVTWDSTFIVSTTYVPPRSELLAHELAHVEQASMLGPLYLPTYGLAALNLAQRLGLFGGFVIPLFRQHHPMEIAANIRAGLPHYWDGAPVPGWRYPWPR